MRWIFKGIQGLFCLSTVSQPKCVSVDGIIRLMESVCLGPKVIPLSGLHCISVTTFWNEKSTIDAFLKVTKKWNSCNGKLIIFKNCFIIKQMIKDLYLETTEDGESMALWSDEQIWKINKKTIHKNSSRALMRNRIMCEINYFHSFLNVSLYLQEDYRY